MNDRSYSTAGKPKTVDNAGRESQLFRMSTPTISQLKHAIALSEQIEKLQIELASLFGGSAKVSAPTAVAPATTAPATKPKKSGFSAEHRAKLAAAAKARWAKKNEAKAPATPVAKAAPAPKKKGGISPEGLARIKAAQKLRWAKFRKGK